MRCFKNLFYFFLLISFFELSAEEVKLINFDEVLPIGSEIIENDEIYTVEVKSEKTFEELKAFKNKMINPLMYVMDVFEDNGVVKFSVFITTPANKKKQTEILFDMSSFKYQGYQKQKSPEFLTYDVPFLLEKIKKRSELAIILSFLALLLLIIVLYFLVKRKKEKNLIKKRKIEKTTKCLKLLENALTRQDFEKIYFYRKEIMIYLELDQNKFDPLLDLINTYQYQRVWTDQELDDIRNAYTLLKRDGGIRGV